MSKLLFVEPVPCFLKKIIPHLFMEPVPCLLKKINSAVHVTDLYNLYITLSCSDVNIFSSFRLFYQISSAVFVHFYYFIVVLPFLTDTPNVTFSFLYVFPLTNSQINLAASFASSFIG